METLAWYMEYASIKMKMKKNATKYRVCLAEWFMFAVGGIFRSDQGALFYIKQNGWHVIDNFL